MPVDPDADVIHFATYTLTGRHRAHDDKLHDARIDSLAKAIKRTVDAWIDSHRLPARDADADPIVRDR